MLMPHPIYTPTQIIVRSIPHIMRSELIFPNLRQSNAASIHSKKSWIFNCSLDSFFFFINVFKCIPLLYYSIFSITSILLYLHSFDHMITHFIPSLKKKYSLLLLALLSLMTPEVVLVVQIFCYQVCSVLQQVLFVSNLLSAVVHYSHQFY